ncbi:hypothetical protein [Methylobacterium sp. ID0610]|uniref:hypothetical protein n=1 Tax=Methylobacterium carpenticola TaxID=3344827 RepID=UPI0036CE5B3C
MELTLKDRRYDPSTEPGLGMLYVCVATLGCAAGLSVRWPGLVVLAGILALATCLAGALYAQSLSVTLMKFAVMAGALNAGYSVPLVVSALLSWQRVPRH